MYSNILNNWFYGEDVQVDDMKLLTKSFLQLCFAANGGNVMATGLTPTITGNNIATTKGFVYFGETSDAIFIERTGTNQLLSFVDPTSVPLIANGYLYVKPIITYDVNNRTSTVSGVVYTSTSATAEGINLATITNSVITQVNSINPLGATQLQRGITQLATQAEVTAGTDASKAVVPSTLATLLSASWQPKLGYTPVQQGGGTGQLTNKLYMGWGTNNRIKVQVDSTDQGNLVTDTYLNNGTLPASFKGALSLVGSGSMYVAGAGDVNGYGFVATTPNGVYAPAGNSTFGAVTMGSAYVTGVTTTNGECYLSYGNGSPSGIAVFSNPGSQGSTCYIGSNDAGAGGYNGIVFGANQSRPWLNNLGTANNSSSAIATLSDVTANGGGIVASGANSNGGWVKFANGFIQQWGFITIPSNGTVTINFPIGFTNAGTVNLQMTSNDMVPNGNAYRGSINIINNSQFQAYNGWQTSQINYYWSAEGY